MRVAPSVGARKRYLPFIESEFPKLYPAYRSAFSGGYQMGDAYREGLSRFMRERCRKHGIWYGQSRDRDDSGPDEEPEVRESDQLVLL